MSEEHKEKIRIANTGKYIGEHHSLKTEFKIGCVSLRKGKKHNPEAKKKIGDVNRGKSYEEIMGEDKAKEKRLSISNRMKNNHPLKGKHHTIETKEKMSKAKKGKPSNVTGKKFPRELYPNMGTRGLIVPKQDTKIEVKIQNYLKELKIEFITHQYIKEIEHGYRCDILIPSFNLIIECDGNYWHNYPIGNKNDIIRNEELKQKGYKVLRFWESEINVMELQDLKNKLIQFRIGA